MVNSALVDAWRKQMGAQADGSNHAPRILAVFYPFAWSSLGQTGPAAITVLEMLAYRAEDSGPKSPRSSLPTAPTGLHEPNNHWRRHVRSPTRDAGGAPADPPSLGGVGPGAREPRAIVVTAMGRTGHATSERQPRSSCRRSAQGSWRKINCEGRGWARAFKLSHIQVCPCLVSWLFPRPGISRRVLLIDCDMNIFAPRFFENGGVLPEVCGLFLKEAG